MPEGGGLLPNNVFRRSMHAFPFGWLYERLPDWVAVAAKLVQTAFWYVVQLTWSNSQLGISQ